MKTKNRLLSIACISLFASSPVWAQASRGIEGCMTTPRSQGGCGPEYNSAPSSSSRGGGGGGGSAAFGQAIDNFNQNLLQQDRQRRMQEAQVEQQANQQRWMEERQKLLEENQRLQMQTQQWQQQQQQQQQQRQSGMAGGGGGAGGGKKSEPKVADTTRGCPFLIHTQYGLTHTPGSRYCHQGKALSCEISEPLGNGNFRYAWKTLPASCSLFPSPAVKEGNTANLYRTSENFFEEEF